MSRFATLATLAAAVALLAPAASADTGSAHTGRCAFLDHDLVEGIGSSADELLAVAVVAVRDAAGGAAGAEVTCELRVNGWLAGHVSASGTGVVVVADTVQYAATPDDELEFCTVVDYADATPTATECVRAEYIKIPPDVHPDTIGTVNDALVEYVDPLLCSVLRTLYLPPGVLYVNSEGDVFVLGMPFWDCPPYGLWT